MENLRAWLDKVDKAGNLKRFDNADWNLEVGYLTACNWKKRDAPALLFDNIKGYPQGFRILTSAVHAPSQVCSVVKTPHRGSDRNLIQALRKKFEIWDANIDKYEPRPVKEGPILQNIRSKDDVDLLLFPTPLWHEKDGGRYIGTGNIVITKDPDSGEVNLGTYRIMIQDKKTAGLYISPGRHGRLHIEKYHARGERCPVAVSLGHHPALFAVGGQQFPAGKEYSYAGAMQEEAVDVITEEVTGLPIPADSEIVIAGWCPPDKLLPEGPFGEFTGYYASGVRGSWVIEVERIYFRDDPILLGAPPGRPPNETNYYNMVVHSAILHNELEKAGVPDVANVCVHDLRNFFVTVALKQRYAGHAKQVAILASELASTGGIGPKYAIVVDEDIDVTDIKEVIWALCTRSDPAEDVDIIRRTRNSALDPALKKPAQGFFSSRAIIDGCRPFEWIKEFPEVIEFSAEIREKMASKFGDLCEP